MLKIYIFILLNMTKHLYNITIPIITYSLGKVLYNMKLKRSHSSYPLLISSLKVNRNSNIAYMVTSSSCILNHSPVPLALIKHTSLTDYSSSGFFSIYVQMVLRTSFLAEKTPNKIKTW